MSKDASKVEMTINLLRGNTESWEKVHDQEFIKQLVEICEYAALSAGELLAHAFRAWLKGAEGQRILGIIEGKKAIAAGDIHDMDDVLKELEGIVRGDDG
jgi:hypothetical protein